MYKEVTTEADLNTTDSRSQNIDVWSSRVRVQIVIYITVFVLLRAFSYVVLLYTQPFICFRSVSPLSGADAGTLARYGNQIKSNQIKSDQIFIHQVTLNKHKMHQEYDLMLALCNR
jgi:hypothetical protein